VRQGRTILRPAAGEEETRLFRGAMRGVAAPAVTASVESAIKSKGRRLPLPWEAISEAMGFALPVWRARTERLAARGHVVFAEERFLIGQVTRDGAQNPVAEHASGSFSQSFIFESQQEAGADARGLVSSSKELRRIFALALRRSPKFPLHEREPVLEIPVQP